MATRWVALRLLLLVATVLLGTYALLTHTTQAPLRALYDDVASGEVEQVRLTPGLAAGRPGPQEQSAIWRTGLRTWRTDVVVVRTAGSAPGSSSGAVGRERTADDLAEQLRQRDPSVQLRTVDGDGAPGLSAGDTRVPWLVLVPTLLLVAGLALLLVRGPEPWRATRWGWFWLALVPGGAVAFLLLSGPLPGLPTGRAPEQAGGRRLGGARALGWALALGLLVGGFGLVLDDVLWPPHP